MALLLDENNFDEKVKSGIAVIDFWAPWCVPCKMMTPVVDKIAANNPDFVVAKVDIDVSPQLAQRFNVMSVPTIIIMKDGEPVDQTIGVVTEKVIMRKIDAIR